MELSNIITNPALSYCQKDYIPQILGIKSERVVDRLLSIEPLSDRIEEQIEKSLGEFDAIPPDNLVMISRILDMNIERLETVARITAVLTQAPSLMLVADGELLRMVIAHSGSGDILKCINEKPTPSLKSLPHTVLVTQELLDLYTRQIQSYILGLVPLKLFQRMIICHPRGVLPAQIALKYPEDHDAFVELFDIACSLLPSVTDNEEEGDVATDSSE